MAKGFRIANGSDWQKVGSGNVRIFDGHDWRPGKAHAWDGHNWIDLLEERHCDTFEATWTQGYWSWGIAKGRSALVSGNRPVQGCYRPYHDSYDRGDEWGMIGFDDAAIRSALAGTNIEKVEVYLHSLHWMYGNGGQCVIGTHNGRGWQSKAWEANHSVAQARFWQRNQGQWITLPNWVGDNFRDNRLSGITVHAGTTNGWYYGYFAGTNDGWMKPKIRFTYTK